MTITDPDGNSPTRNVQVTDWDGYKDVGNTGYAFYFQLFLARFGIGKWNLPDKPYGILGFAKNGEPDDISDVVTKNKDWVKRIIINKKKGIIYISIGTKNKPMTVGYQPEAITESKADDIIKNIMKIFQGRFKDGNQKYIINIHLKLLTGLDNALNWKGADLVIRECGRACQEQEASGMAVVGESTIYIRRYTLSDLQNNLNVSLGDTPAHEFAHNLGLRHDANSTESIRSYFKGKKGLKPKDIKLLINAYAP